VIPREQGQSRAWDIGRKPPAVKGGDGHEDENDPGREPRKVQEKALIEELGKRYQTYSEDRKRLVPFVW